MARFKRHTALFYIYGLYAVGYSQEQIAEFAGVSRGSIIRWLTHKFSPSEPMDMMIVGYIDPIYSELLKNAEEDGLSIPHNCPVTPKSRIKKKSKKITKAAARRLRVKRKESRDRFKRGDA